MPALSPGECDALAGKRVCVIGCGGLGGYVVELLARTGVGTITVVDADVFCESNLNRQLFSNEQNLGMPKVLAARERIQAVNASVTVNAIEKQLDDENAGEILAGHDVVVDALDNVPSRLVLEAHCNRLSIPLVHGAIGGWSGQVTTVLPGYDTLFRLYRHASGDETEPGNLAFTAAATAAFQCGEVLKLLTGRGKPLSQQVLRLDLLENDFFLIDII